MTAVLLPCSGHEVKGEFFIDQSIEQPDLRGEASGLYKARKDVCHGRAGSSSCYFYVLRGGFSRLDHRKLNAEKIEYGMGKRGGK